MKDTKRLLSATAMGMVAGFICYGFASSGTTALPVAVAAQIILSRTLIGFAIGISKLKTYWWLHGLLFGFLFSLPLAFSGLLAPETQLFSSEQIFISTIVMGGVYGVLIELITSVFFRLKNE